MTSKPCAPADLDGLAEKLAELAMRAGQEILSVYGAQDPGVRLKADQSPVTNADERAEAVILNGLHDLLPGIPVLAEEAASRGERPDLAPVFVMVDALDGTREFLNRNGEFTVNIALILDGVPRCGAVFAPVLGRVWYGAHHAFACDVAVGSTQLPASRAPIHVRQAPEKLCALVSRSHGDEQTEDYLTQLPIGSRTTIGSSIKFCRIAEGEGDVYVRFSPTMEWDIAAGHAVLAAAGGDIVNLNGAPLIYGKSDLHNPPFIAWGDMSIKNRLFPGQTN